MFYLILENLGVAKKDIIAETQSLNTTENARYTKQYLQQYNYKRPLLVTSAFQMRRAVARFQGEIIQWWK